VLCCAYLPLLVIHDVHQLYFSTSSPRSAHAINRIYFLRTTTRPSPTTVSPPYMTVVITIAIHDLTSAAVLGRQGKVGATARCIAPSCKMHVSSLRRGTETPGYTLFDFVAACGRSTGVPYRCFVACSQAWLLAVARMLGRGRRDACHTVRIIMRPACGRGCYAAATME
jgi:hypothetical protein